MADIGMILGVTSKNNIQFIRVCIIQRYKRRESEKV